MWQHQKSTDTFRQPFPRDPAEVNQFAEHIVLGQILEPMVDTDKMGNVTPGLAESWTFEDKGLTIKFKIRKDRVFSNGKKLEAKDIKYTIDRVIQKKSQSSNFLGSISSIEASASTPSSSALKSQMCRFLKLLVETKLVSFLLIGVSIKILRNPSLVRDLTDF